MRLDSIADPTRLAVARHLAAQPGSTAPQVARGAGVHLNTARTHLEALERASLVERTVERGRVGRPRVRFRLAPDWSPQGDDLLGLSTLLATALVQLHAEPQELRRAGRRWGRRWTVEMGGAPVEERLISALRRLGFRAAVRGDRLELSECPCPLAAPDRPPLVCGLVDAVVDGVLEGSGTSVRAHLHDPEARRCSARLVISPN